jgi:hypothetical protein
MSDLALAEFDFPHIDVYTAFLIALILYAAFLILYTAFLIALILYPAFLTAIIPFYLQPLKRILHERIIHDCRGPCLTLTISQPSRFPRGTIPKILLHRFPFWQPIENLLKIRPVIEIDFKHALDSTYQ